MAAFADLGTTTAVTDDTESSIKAFLYANCMNLNCFGLCCRAIRWRLHQRTTCNCRQPEERYTLSHRSCTFPSYGVVSVPNIHCPTLSSHPQRTMAGIKKEITLYLSPHRYD